MFGAFPNFLCYLSLIFYEIKGRQFLIRNKNGTYLLKTKDSGMDIEQTKLPYGPDINTKKEEVSTDKGEDMEKIHLKGDTLGRRSSHNDYNLGPKRDPPTKDPSPKCLKPPCKMKKIKTKFYVSDDLWNSFQKVGDERIKTMFDNTVKGVNEYLSKLDNGGYKVVVEDPLIQLNNSDVQFKENYVDRLDRNKTKNFDKTKIEAYTFAFQEAVQELQNRNDVDLRILLIQRQSYFHPYAQTEEHCICNPTGFGCITVLSIRSPTNWGTAALLTHEIGHALGPYFHDDLYYKQSFTSGDLLLWPAVNPEAHIWSPKVREKINEQDHSCLQLDSDGGSNSVPDSKLSYAHKMKMIFAALGKQNTELADGDCNKPKGVIGKCNLRITMWTYYKSLQGCFPSFGCEGTGNNFISKEVCEKKCISGSKPDPDDEEKEKEEFEEQIHSSKIIKNLEKNQTILHDS